MFLFFPLLLTNHYCHAKALFYVRNNKYIVFYGRIAAHKIVFMKKYNQNIIISYTHNITCITIIANKNFFFRSSSSLFLIFALAKPYITI